MSDNAFYVSNDGDGDGLSDPAPLAGSRFAESLTNVGTDLSAAGSEDWDWSNFAIDGAVAGLDVLAFALNPFKELVMAGVGFLIEHVDFLREPLEWFTGDPNAISALTETWSNIAGGLQASSGSVAEMMAEVEGWKGDAADAYKSVGAAYSELLDGTASAAQAVSQCYMVIGIIVSTLKAIVLELLCEFVSRAIMIGLAALANAAWSFGGSIGAGIAMTITSAIQTSAKIGTKVSKGLAKVAEALSQIKHADNAFGKMIRSVSQMADELAGGIANNMRALDIPFDKLKDRFPVLKGDMFNFNGGYNLPQPYIPGYGRVGGPTSIADDVGDAYGSVKNVWDNGLKWGENGSGLAYLAEVAGGTGATGLRGFLGGMKNNYAAGESGQDAEESTTERI
ncbi:hypothetical protein L0U85_00520 [Glycomyces sp. L485]|uniref:WXG100 family type VII secretion target n=1 Tax=Glycomyces sp. L485 TaxID=2909235 RepID=UPI001F4B8968|nr:hypothetical protein [Glycomyces sp. L485]MCH7229352.1 hypothetical protein [Glycomyces sp. L485]